MPAFESLLQRAIQFANEKNKHVIVLSIPDWGATPFSKGWDRKQIAKEINEYNTVNKKIAENYKVHYLDIASGTRQAAKNPFGDAADGLHPSSMEYRRWAENIAAFIKQHL